MLLNRDIDISSAKTCLKLQHKWAMRAVANNKTSAFLLQARKSKNNKFLAIFKLFRLHLKKKSGKGANRTGFERSDCYLAILNAE